jgi:hypothetical protein
MAYKRTSEEQAILLMKLFTNWLQVWIEIMDEEPENRGGLSVEFGVMQIEGLQQCLERVKRKLENSEK